MGTTREQGSDGPNVVPSLAFEQHYTVQQIAELWNLSAASVRRMFLDEPGVLKFGTPGIAGKRRPHVTLSIPASVVERFHQQRAAGFQLKRRR